MDYMKDAYTCGFEISDDFTKVIDSPEDNSWYYPFILPACAQMQMLSGKTCQEITVEYIEIDGEGEIISTIIYPEERQMMPMQNSFSNRTFWCGCFHNFRMKLD